MANATGSPTEYNNNNKQGKSVFGYWRLRGRSFPIRLLLEYTQEPYELCDYPIPDFAKMKGTPIADLFRRRCEAEQKQEGVWFSDKYKLGLDFPNLPYLMVGGASSDLKISQTYAICRYIARKHKLDGNDERQRIITDMLEQVYDEMRNAHRMVVWPDSEYEPKKQIFLNHALPKSLCLLAKYLNGKEFFLNTDKPMYADFLLFDYLDIQQRYAPDVVARFPNLVAFIRRMQQVPAIAAFMRDQALFVVPVYPMLCYWTGEEGAATSTATAAAADAGEQKQQCCGSDRKCG